MCTEAQADKMIALLSDSHVHISNHELLVEIARDLRNLVDHLREKPETTIVGVSSTHPLYVDKRDRWHLYIFSSVPLELFFADLATQVGNAALAPFTVPGGKFIEVPFRTGDKLICPSIPIAQEIAVYLLAQNEVLAV